jgi:hypothetical protein
MIPIAINDETMALVKTKAKARNEPVCVYIKWLFKQAINDQSRAN